MRAPRTCAPLTISLVDPLAIPATRLSRGGRVRPFFRRTTVVGVCAFASITWLCSALGSLRQGAPYWRGRGSYRCQGVPLGDNALVAKGEDPQKQ
jgi:hypothetical protein